MNDPADDPARAIRRLLRAVPRVALGTVMRGANGAPYVSLAMVAVDHDATPLLLLSNLADHTKNIAADPRLSLLFDGTAGAEVPLAGERATVQGRAIPSDDAAQRARYVARHLDAATYLGFGDFRLYRVEIEQAHLVAGFGRIHWVDGALVRYPDGESIRALRAAEARVVERLNREHAVAVREAAGALLGRAAEDWTVSGVDPEGIDLRRGTETARLVLDIFTGDADVTHAALASLRTQVRTAAGLG